MLNAEEKETLHKHPHAKESEHTELAVGLITTTVTHRKRTLNRNTKGCMYSGIRNWLMNTPVVERRSVLFKTQQPLLPTLANSFDTDITQHRSLPIITNSLDTDITYR